MKILTYYLIMISMSLALTRCVQTIDPFENIAPKFQEGRYTIVEDSTKLHLVVYDFIANVSAVKVDTWIITRAEENFFHIQTEDGDYLQEIANNEVIVSDYNYSEDQMWGFVKYDNNSFVIKNRLTGRNLFYEPNTFIIYTAPRSRDKPTKFVLVRK